MGIKKQKLQMRYMGQFGLLAGFVLLLVGFLSCKEDYSFRNAAMDGIPFDPNKPVEVGTIMPDSGGYKTPFVIEGSNFGTDISKIKVIFSGENTTRVAPLVRSNGELIYGIMPKLDNGLNEVRVEIEGLEKVMSPTRFSYTKVEQVTTVAGKNGVAGYVDGTLVESRFGNILGMNVVTGNNLIICEGKHNRVRMLSVDENKVSTLMTGYNFGHPAVTKDGTTAYVVAIGSPHIVFRFAQKDSWTGKKMVSSIIDKEKGLIDGDIYACVLDDEEKYLYFRDHKGRFARLEIADPVNVEILNEKCGDVDKQISYIAWNPVDKCFYMTVQNAQGIYKVSNDGKQVEPYAGFNGIGGEDGPRLNASFRNPTGMAFDADGNMYVTDSMGFIIRKINRIDGLVTTVAGQYNKNGGDDGLPLDARFNYPYDICIDDEGSFYIGLSHGCSVRKYAVE